MDFDLCVEISNPQVVFVSQSEQTGSLTAADNLSPSPSRVFTTRPASGSQRRRMLMANIEVNKQFITWICFISREELKPGKYLQVLMFFEAF